MSTLSPERRLGALCCPRCGAPVSIETVLEIERSTAPVRCEQCHEELRLLALRHAPGPD
jgi:transcription elongation factor Elf1